MTRWKLRLGEVCEARLWVVAPLSSPKFWDRSEASRVETAHLGEPGSDCLPQSLYAMQATFSTTSISNLHRPHNLRQTPKHTACWVAVVVQPGRSMVTRPATKPLTSHSCPHLTDGHEPAATGLNGDTNFTEGEGRIKDKNKTVLASCHCGGKTQPDDK